MRRTDREASLVGRSKRPVMGNKLLDNARRYRRPKKHLYAWENLAIKNRIRIPPEPTAQSCARSYHLSDAGYRTETVRAPFVHNTHTHPGVIDGVYPVFGRDDYVAKGRNYKIMPADTGAPEVVINDQHFKRLVYSYIEREGRL